MPELPDRHQERTAIDILRTDPGAPPPDEVPLWENPWKDAPDRGKRVRICKLLRPEARLPGSAKSSSGMHPGVYEILSTISLLLRMY